MRTLAAVALTTLFLFSTLTEAGAQPPRVERVLVMNYGLYGPPATDEKGIFRGISPALRNIRTTRQVPAQPGVRFGFRFKVEGKPDGAKIILKNVWIFPAGGLRNPATGQIRHRSEITLPVTMGKTVYSAYRFDEAWEMVPGRWTLELWYEGHRIATQRFTVFRP